MINNVEIPEKYLYHDFSGYTKIALSARFSSIGNNFEIMKQYLGIEQLNYSFRNSTRCERREPFSSMHHYSTTLIESCLNINSTSNLETVNLLINNGACVNYNLDKGLSTIHYLIYHKVDPKIIELFIEKKVKMKYNKTIKQLFKTRNNKYIMNILTIFEKYKFKEKNGYVKRILLNLFPKFTNNDYTSSILVAYLIDYFEINVNEIDEDSNIALFNAFFSGNTEVIKLLIEKSNVNYINKEKVSILMRAINIDLSTNIIELLINKHADLNYINNNGSSILRCAIKRQVKSETLILLIEKGCNIHDINNDGESILECAIKNCVSSFIIKLLIEKGCDVNIITNYGNTILMYVVKSLFYGMEIINLILSKYTLDINIKNKEGKSVLNYAFDTYSKKIIDMLFQKGATMPENIDFNKKFINFGRRIPNYNNEYNLVPKYTITNTSRYSSIYFLLEYSTNINFKDNYGKTLMMYLCEQSICDDNVNLIEFLISRGANIYDKDSDGNGLLSIILNEFQNPLTANLLLNNGVCINKQNEYGNTPLINFILKQVERNYCKLYKKFISEINKKKPDYSLLKNNLLEYKNKEYIEEKYYYKEYKCINDYDVIKMLLEYGASIHLKNIFGHNPINLITKYLGYASHITELLISYNNKFNMMNNYDVNFIYFKK